MIEKYMDLSTGYVTRETAEWLDEQPSGIIMYPKGEYGWFIYTGYIDELPEVIPDDLVRVIKYARKKKCGWIVLDRDGDDDIMELPFYEW